MDPKLKELLLAECGINEYLVDNNYGNTTANGGANNHRDVCRVCTSPALYDIHSSIPLYVHSYQDEYTNWQKPIANLIKDVTGCDIKKHDGLPQKICPLCISYLQHAVTFRDQYIRNTENLKVALKILQNDDVNEKVGKTSNAGCRKIINEDPLENKIPNKPIKSSVKSETDGCQYNYNENLSIIQSKKLHLQSNPGTYGLDLFFNDGDCMYALTPDDNETKHDKKLKLQNAIHKIFEYDDADLDEQFRLNEFQTVYGKLQEQHTKKADADEVEVEDTEQKFQSRSYNRNRRKKDGFKLNVRKCEWCQRMCYVLSDYVEHIDDCIFRKLTDLTNELHLYETEFSSRACSQIDYIRRSIFSIKRCVKRLAKNYIKVLRNAPSPPPASSSSSSSSSSTSKKAAWLLSSPSSTPSTTTTTTTTSESPSSSSSSPSPSSMRTVEKTMKSLSITPDNATTSNKVKHKNVIVMKSSPTTITTTTNTRRSRTENEIGNSTNYNQQNTFFDVMKQSLNKKYSHDDCSQINPNDVRDSILENDVLRKINTKQSNSHNNNNNNNNRNKNWQQHPKKLIPIIKCAYCHFEFQSMNDLDYHKLQYH